MWSVGKLQPINKCGSHFEWRGGCYFNPVVSIVSGVLIWGFVIVAMVTKKDLGTEMTRGQSWVTDIWNWLYMISQNVWVLVLLWMMFKYWNLKLGKDDEPQEFGDATWFAMLFSCGVATGLWFFTAEGMWHYEGYGNPRWMDEEMFNHNTRAEHALMVCFFHWGVHGWIPYSLIGAVLAIMCYRRNYPMSMRFCLYPLIGELCYGIVGDVMEILSICCTLFGVCTSLVLGALQLSAGLVRLDKGTFHGEDLNGSPRGYEATEWMQTILIADITVLATASVVAGLKRGIARLAVIAFVLSAFILFSVLFMDNTWYILNALTSAVGYYLWYLPKISFHTDAWEELDIAPDSAHAWGDGILADGAPQAKGWMNGWTIFYWGWWISWGPFCGTFLARISRGRTLGSYILGSLIIPSIWSFMFLGIFGAAQIRISMDAINAGLIGGAANLTYGRIAAKAFADTPGVVGYNITNEDGEGNLEYVWTAVSESTTRLYMLGTTDVLFEHLQSYAGTIEFSTFMTIVTWICILLYFVTSSDSASFVIDMLAANGVEEPPTIQKVFWCLSEGAAAIALLWAGARSVVAALPIILGLPFTFVLFWVAQAAIILCKEEAGEIPVDRKNFQFFILNYQPESFIGILAPFIPFGHIAAKTWNGNKMMYTIGFAIAWIVTLVVAILSAADNAFSYMACCMLILDTVAIAVLRMSARAKLGITGDIISDGVACLFYWCALGQMFAEDFDAVAPAPKASVPQVAQYGKASDEDVSTRMRDFEARITAQLSNMQSDFDKKLSHVASTVKPMDGTL